MNKYFNSTLDFDSIVIAYVLHIPRYAIDIGVYTQSSVNTIIGIKLSNCVTVDNRNVCACTASLLSLNSLNKMITTNVTAHSVHSIQFTKCVVNVGFS